MNDNNFKFKAYDDVNDRIFNVEILSNGLAYESWRDWENGVKGSKKILQCLDLVCDKGELSYMGDIVMSNGKVIVLKDFFDIGYMIHECTLIDGDYTKIGNIYTHPELLDQCDE